MFNEEGEIRLLRERHAAYVSKGLKYLGPGFICLDARCVSYLYINTVIASVPRVRGGAPCRD